MIASRNLGAGMLALLAICLGWDAVALSTGSQRLDVQEQIPLNGNEEKIEIATQLLTSDTPSGRVVILGRLSLANTSWVQSNLADWQDTIYTTLESSVLSTDGSTTLDRQVLPYLTYLLISSPATSSVAFVHPKRTTETRVWNTNTPDHDAKTSKSLNLGELAGKGYAKLHCGNGSCSASVEDLKENLRVEYETEGARLEVWRDALSRDDVVRTIGIMCCGSTAGG
ncbi:hypothetical protein P280DRAFT_480038 [Massarina eburnea CBS 473.64]|uniref:Uncharacterized protein n=1 Tax=Massarina eburnea CBS 473.64 TaxID=1395130 RepID=A0A6A6RYS4_9PLEO|nr:hypothetical protein P280DRAFT_480038 [Massarina eburnea CBS 473.64]